jgi:hypothetical protein
MRAGRTGVAVRIAVAASLAAALAGCAYDYVQRTDRVAYHAGDAVKANLEAETTNPSKPSMYETKGLGKNGSVVPPSTIVSAPTSTP